MPVEVRLDFSKFTPRMKQLGANLDRAGYQINYRIAAKLTELMKREPPCPRRTGRLIGSIQPDKITLAEVVVAPHTEYAGTMEAMYGYVEKAGQDIKSEAQRIAEDVLRAWSV